MNISEFAKPVTAKSLNESLEKRFGKKLSLESFTIEQLQNARNKLRTKLSQIEMSESFNAVVENDDYQKSKLFLDILNAELSERGDVDEENIVAETTINEGAEDQAEIVMAAKDMVDRVTGWMEDTAEMKTESMLDLADAIRDELGVEQSNAYVETIKASLDELYTSMEGTRAALSNGVGMLTGEGEAMPAPMGGDDMPMDPSMEPTVDQDDAAIPAGDDDFAAAEPAAGGDAPAGREARESVDPRKLATTLASKKK
jgi:hypothetical protein